MPANRVQIKLAGLIDPSELSGDRQFSMNLARGLEVLRAFSIASPALGNKELCEITGLPKATVARLTYTLVMLGFLSQDQIDQRYRLGPGVLSLAHPLLATMAIRGIARPFMQKLASETGCSVNLGVRDRNRVIYVEAARADRQNPLLPDIGSSRPLLAGAIGRVLVLANPAGQTQHIINRLKTFDPAAYEKHSTALRADVALFRREGYCHARGDWHSDIHAIAVAVADPTSRETYALNCSLNISSHEKEHLRENVLPKLKAIRDEIEHALRDEQCRPDHWKRSKPRKSS